MADEELTPESGLDPNAPKSEVWAPEFPSTPADPAAKYPREMYRLDSDWDKPDHKTVFSAKEEKALGKEWVNGHVFYSRPAPQK